MGSLKAQITQCLLTVLSLTLIPACQSPKAPSKPFAELPPLPSITPETPPETPKQHLTCVVSLDVKGDIDGDINVDNNCKPIISPEQIQIADPKLKELALAAHKSLIENQCEESLKEYTEAAATTRDPILLGYFGSRIEYARQCIERNIRVVEKTLDNPKSPESETHCKDYSGYTKGTWRGFIEHGYVSARLCQRTPFKGQFTFHWNTGTVSSYVSGISKGSEFHLEEPREKWNGEMKLTQEGNTLSGTYQYYQNEYPAYEIKLIEQGLPQELHALNMEQVNHSLLNATEQDPLLTLLKNIRSNGYPEPHYLLEVEGGTDTSGLSLKITDESLNGDTFAGLRKVIALKQTQGQWQSSEISEEVKCGDGETLSYQSAPCPQ